MASKGTKISEAEEKTSLSGTEKFPLSDGSGSAKYATTNTIKKFVGSGGGDGKVKDVQVDGQSVLNEQTGIANIAGMATKSSVDAIAGRTTDLELEVNGKSIFHKVEQVSIRIGGSSATTFTSTYKSYTYQVKTGDKVVYTAQGNGKNAYFWGVTNDMTTAKSGDTIQWVQGYENEFMHSSNVGGEFTVPSDCWLVINIGNPSDPQTPSAITVNGNDVLNGWKEIVNGIVDDIYGIAGKVFSYTKEVQEGDTLRSEYFTAEYKAGNTVYISISEDLGTDSIATHSLRFYNVKDGKYQQVTMSSGVVTLNDDCNFARTYTAKTATVAGKYTIVLDDKKTIQGIKQKVENHDIILSKIEKDELPSYYDVYLSNKIDYVRELVRETTSAIDTFVFFTDAHWIQNAKNSPLVIQEILKSGISSKVFFGGDICNNAGGHSGVIDSINSLMDIRHYISPYGDFLCCRGNHDLNGPEEGKESGQDYNLSDYAVKTIMMMGNNCESYENDVQYFFDNHTSRIRYIVSYAVGTDDEDSIEWLAQTAIDTPSGYNIVIVNHDGAIKATSSYYVKHEHFNNLVEALSAKNNYGNFVFSKIEGRLLAVISGHTHNDIQALKHGVAHICTAADARLSDGNYLGKMPNKRNTIGTTDEQLMDVVLVTESRTNCIRFGRGYDRFFDTQVKYTNVNARVTLNTSLAGDIIWYVYDVDKSYNETEETHASVDNGVFMATQPGIYTVSAMDTNGTREFFEVDVD